VQNALVEATRVDMACGCRSEATDELSAKSPREELQYQVTVAARLGDSAASIRSTSPDTTALEPADRTR